MIEDNNNPEMYWYYGTNSSLAGTTLDVISKRTTSEKNLKNVHFDKIKSIQGDMPILSLFTKGKKPIWWLLYYIL